MSAYQHDPTYDHDAQQTAQDAFPPPLRLSDLSDVEKEALSLLRLAPRTLNIYADLVGTLSLKASVREVQVSLLSNGLIQWSFPEDNVLGFVHLTPDGLRLQAELWQQGGNS